MKYFGKFSKLLVLLIAFQAFGLQAQTKHATHQLSSTDGLYKYTTVENDPLQARVYVLKNGLTVYMSVNRNEPRIQTMIAVRAGSKNDPSETTGLAHYLEHLLFKGTDRYGSLDYSREKPLLDSIENLFEVYREMKDPELRKAIYHHIDSISGESAKWAIANEYDKMVGTLGARGTNAFTSNEQTVYVNDIPSNQLKKWTLIEGERFRNPVLRLFHTELEAVYEEKNRSLDNDGRTVSEAMEAALFQKHPYGTQTTIGTVEHLKNPSIKRIKAFYAKNYVPNNMAVCISGDFDPDVAIREIDAAFGSLEPKPIAPFTFDPEDPIAAPIKKEVFGPDAESVLIGFRYPGINNPDIHVLDMIDLLLSNSSAGLIDVNLNQKQLVLSASSTTDENLDYSVHFLSGRPRTGQTLDEVAGLLLAQIESIKQGAFDEKLLPAIVNSQTIGKIKGYESNRSRASEMMQAFILHQNWSDVAGDLDDLAQVTKADVLRVANKYYHNNYVIVYKRTGTRPDVVKVVKPAITPVSLNREAQSPFLQQIAAMPAEKIAPKFIDYKKDIQETKLASGVPVFYRHNDENQLFELYYKIDMGRKDNKRMSFALGYMNYLGTNTMTVEEVKRKFFELGMSFNLYEDNDQFTISLTGLDKNFTQGVKLFENILANLKGDQAALDALVARSLKGRADSKKNKNAILAGMRSYGTYGKLNPFNDNLSEAELKSLKPEELVGYLQDLTHFEHHVLYYGPRKLADVRTELNTLHKTPKTLKPVPNTHPYTFQDTKENVVYFVNYPMAQAEVVLLSKSMQYDAKIEPTLRLYNEYFGGGMSSLVFQTIRESKALAYAVSSSFTGVQYQTDPRYISAYVGTQADKLPETMKGMFELLTDMPEADKIFIQAKEAILNRIETERITRSGILFDYERARRMGFDHDMRRDVYTSVPTMAFADISNFQHDNVRGKHYNILVLGSKEKIDQKMLASYGNIVELKLEDVFGY
jgi:predicted Zn-dependent peptidase